MTKALRAIIIGGFALMMLGTSFAPRAQAQCVSIPSSNTKSPQLPAFNTLGQLINASFAEPGSEQARIVGYWKAQFLSEGNIGIPDGTVLDAPLVQWHGDGTEIMNSTRDPTTQSFCTGVWHKTGKSTYQLNHFTLSWDGNHNFVGPGQIQESVTLNKAGNAYTGTFTIDQYDPNGNLIVELKGNQTATRITVNSTIDQVL
jgi:hypothetical protein